jgi:hypothetical protein
MALRRYRSLVLTVPFLLLGGCGGCDSCFSAAGPDDDAAASATSHPLTKPVVDAAPAAEPDATEDASSTDAAVSTKDATAIPIPTVARPKAPMPLGAYQVCGKYDGPLCEKACPKGACRQECDAVKCDLTCVGGYCSQVCGIQGECKLSCPGGHCIQVCAKPEGCTKDCAGGSCE